MASSEEESRPLGDRRLVVRAGLALAVANARYWPSVWPLVRSQLRSWERRAHEIQEPELRALALGKLDTEAFNAEVAATLATLAPGTHRKHAVEAIVALELLFDYLDGLTERPSTDPLREGQRLFAPFISAVAVPPDGVGESLEPPRCNDGGYLEALSHAVVVALAKLPAAAAITDVAQESAARCAQAQIRIHAEPHLGTAQLEEWAEHAAGQTGLQWRELAAGAASSVLAVHALIAAAADPRTTSEEAAEIEAAYLSICVLVTVLDSLADYDEDVGAGGPGFVRFYEDRDQLAATLASVARRAWTQAAALRAGPHHVMTLAGVVAYYTSAPGRAEIAQPVAEQLQIELRPLLTPTLAVMHSWRLAKRAHRRWRRTGEHRV